MLNNGILAGALDTIAQLDRDLTLAVEHADAVAVHVSTAQRALEDLRRALVRSIIGTRDLRERLLAVAGDASEQQQEVGLRERTAAIVTRLADLALADYEPNTDANDLYVGRFHRLHDVSTHLLDEIASLNQACFLARLAAESWRDDDDVHAAARQASYRSALACANLAFVAIGKDPDLARFLRAGVVVTSQPFQSACREIATLLEVDLELGEIER